MDIRLTHGRATSHTVEAISSKSYVHRLLIAAALSGEDIEVKTNIVSKDMEATAGALASLGLRTAGIRVASATSENDRVIDCGESGSTARFILPLAALLSDGATITGSGKLPERPMGPLCSVLRAAGVSVSDDHLPITVSGRPHSGSYEIPGNVSSQFISGLLFMLPLLDGDSHLKVTGPFESAAYVDMTIDVLTRFGIRINKTPDGFDIPGNQKYSKSSNLSDRSLPLTIKAEGDWSNGAYIMAIGALGCGRIFDSLSITGLNPESIQGDRAVVEIFSRFGIDVDIVPAAEGDTAEYVIKSGPTQPVNTDCSQIPDLVPALAVIAAFTEGENRFRNVSRLRMKESDRVEAIVEMLGAIGIKVDITRDGDTEDMIVHGAGRCSRDSQPTSTSSMSPCPHLFKIRTFNDHRIAMAAAAIAAAVDTPVVIEDAMAVNKSYPGFYEVIQKIGLESGPIG